MFFLNLLLALLAPFASGLLMQGYRKNRIYRALIQLPGGSREETADRVQKIVEENMGKDLTLGAALAVSTVFFNLTIANNTLGLIIAGVVTPVLFGGLLLRDYRPRIRRATRDAALKALDQFLETRSAQVGEGALEGLMSVEDEKLQIAVTNRTMNWGSFWALNRLRRTQNESPFVEVRQLALNSADSVREILDTVNVRRLADLLSLFNRARYWRRLGNGVSSRTEGSRLLGLETGSGSDPEPIAAAFTFQSKLHAASPHNYCLACGTRSEINADQGWKHVRCVTCKEANDLVPGVKQVVGHIGPQLDPILSSKGYLPINLWNPVSDSARAVAMDQLVITAGGDFNYDWAISAALEAFRNRFPDRETRIKVTLDPQLDLSTNTLNLLKSIAPKNQSILPAPSLTP